MRRTAKRPQITLIDADEPWSTKGEILTAKSAKDPRRAAHKEQVVYHTAVEMTGDWGSEKILTAERKRTENRTEYPRMLCWPRSPYRRTAGKPGLVSPRRPQASPALPTGNLATSCPPAKIRSEHRSQAERPPCNTFPYATGALIPLHTRKITTVESSQ